MKIYRFYPYNNMENTISPEMQETRDPLQSTSQSQFVIKEAEESQKSDNEEPLIKVDNASVNTEEDPLKIESNQLEITPKTDVPVSPTCTGYILWSTNRGKELLETYPTLNLSDLTIRLNTEWQYVSEQEKNYYRNQEIIQNSPKINQPIPKRAKRKYSLNISKCTCFVLWCQKMRPIISKQYPDMAFGDVSKYLGELWNNLSEDNQLKFAKQIEEDFHKEVIPEKKKITSQKRLEKKARPRIPKYTCFTVWSRKMRPIVTKQYPDTSFGDVTKYLREMWKTVSDTEKSEYRILAKELNEEALRIAKHAAKELVGIDFPTSSSETNEGTDFNENDHNGKISKLPKMENLKSSSYQFNFEEVQIKPEN